MVRNLTKLERKPVLLTFDINTMCRNGVRCDKAITRRGRRARKRNKDKKGGRRIGGVREVEIRRGRDE